MDGVRGRGPCTVPVAVRAAVVVMVALGVCAAGLAAAAGPVGAAEVWLTRCLVPGTERTMKAGSHPWEFQFSGHRLAWSANDPDWGAYGVIQCWDFATDGLVSLTNNAGAALDLHHRFDGPHLVWAQWPPLEPTQSDSELYLHDLTASTTTALTSNSTGDFRPSVDAGLLAWEGHDGADCEIYIQDLWGGPPMRITDNDVEDQHPETSEGTVVWQRDEGAKAEIWLFRTGTGHARLTDNKSEDHGAVVEGRVVAWLSHDGSDDEVMVRNLAGGSETQLTDNAVGDGQLRLAGGRLAWVSGADGAAEIHIWDPTRGGGLISAIHRITSDTREDALGDLDGEYLVWQSWDGSDWEILVYRFADGTTRQLTDNDFDDVNPTVTNGRIAWRRGYDRDIVDLPTWMESKWDVMVAARMRFELPLDHPYLRAIEGMAAAGYVVGYARSDGTHDFRAEDPVNRAQFAKMIVESLQLHVTEDMISPFGDLGLDVPDNLYPHEYVAVAADKDITKGTGSGNFSPWDDIGRAQVITMMVRAAQALRPGSLATPGAGFPGSLGNFSSDHASAARIAEFNGLLDGLVGFGSAWDPWQPATRGEVAQMLWNLLGRLGR